MTKRAKGHAYGRRNGHGAGSPARVSSHGRRDRDANGWRPEFKAFIPQMTVEMFLGMPFAEEYRKLAPMGAIRGLACEGMRAAPCRNG